jgi:hypothetical protein
MTEKLKLERRGRLRYGNPIGDPSTAPRCAAKTRNGIKCRAPAMRNPKTADILAVGCTVVLQLDPRPWRVWSVAARRRGSTRGGPPMRQPNASVEARRDARVAWSCVVAEKYTK